jgi:hypothetical protein
LTRSAGRSAWLAVEDAWTAYRDTLDPSDLQFITQIALVCSHSHLLQNQPVQAEACLDLVRQAAAVAKRPTPADYFRQSGVAAFQRGDDLAARCAFEQAATALADQEPNRSELDIRFTSARHTAALEPVDWEGARSLLGEIGHAFGEDRLHFCMMTHWTVAAGFQTDSPRIVQESSDLLERIRLAAMRFGHQATISRLLALTPDLRLPPSLRRTWVRKLMYVNAFQER